MAGRSGGGTVDPGNEGDPSAQRGGMSAPDADAPRDGLLAFDPGADAEFARALSDAGVALDGDAFALSDACLWQQALPIKPGVSHDLDILSAHQWQRYGAARNAPTAARVLALWRQRLRRLAELASDASDATVLCMLRHAQPAQDAPGTRYAPEDGQGDVFSAQYPISADAFLTLAASAGLFCAEPPVFTRDGDGVCDRALYAMSRRGFTVRFARASDISALERLERLCWIAPLRTGKRALLARIKRYPQGQFVLERDGEVKGVIYSQRIRDAEDLSRCTMDDVHTLHDPDGDVVQLLAVNIDPAIQHLASGDQLLEFMLQRSCLQRRVSRVVAVTLCKDYVSGRGLSFEKYTTGPGRERDRVLHFHHAHGAEIAAILPGYRPRDVANEGNGVLVAYTPTRRRPRPAAAPVAAVSDDASASLPGAEAAPADPTAGAPDREQVLAYVLQAMGALIDDESAAAADRPLMESGLDSAGMLALKSRLESRFGKRLKPSFFFTHNTPAKVVEFYCPAADSHQNTQASTQHGAAATVAASAASGETGQAGVSSTATGASSSAPMATASLTGEGRDDIAIIGLACRLPGGVDGLESLWRMLDEGREAIVDYPASRGAWPRVGPIGRGGFLQDGECFDAGFFRMSPSEAELTDPQQRLLLEVSWACFEDACVTPATLRGSDTGVFVGASNSDYAHRLQQVGAEVEAHTAVGNSLAVLANRLSYFYDFNGPSFLIDTACSASLVALHAALRSLRSRECGLALVGGVNFICDPRISLSYHKAGMLSPDGRCKVFDDAADGYVRAEGAVVVLLKRLSQAVADGDRIHAVIRGSAINHGGQAAGLTVPNPQQQSALLTSAWRDAGVSPQDISYLEAHGTGTSLGDPIEIEGMQSAFATAAPAPAALRCGVGSIKSNLGHLESAAGLAGVLKVVAGMAHRRLPATLHVTRTNSRMSLEGSPLRIQAAAEDWNLSGPRIAGVSSFGSGGANAHVVLQDYRDDAAQTGGQDADGGADHVFVLSAVDADALRRDARAVLDWLAHRPSDVALIDAIGTWQCGRTAFRERLALRVDDFDVLASQLTRWVEGVDSQVRAGRAVAQSGGASGDAAARWRAAASAGDLDTLASLWLEGREGDWADLYAGTARRWRPVSLPGHVFEKNRFWVESAEVVADAAREDAAETGTGATRCLAPTWERSELSGEQAAPQAGAAAHHVLLWTRRQLEDAQLAAAFPDCSIRLCTATGDDPAALYQALAETCLGHVRGLLSHRQATPAQIQLVADGGDLGEWVFGLRGLLESARIEEPGLGWQILSVPVETSLQTLAALLASERRAFASGASIQYRDAGRFVRGWTELPAPAGGTRRIHAPLRAGGAYLITGGLGGLGRLFAQHILQTVPDARVFVTGRGERDARVAALLDQWPADARPEYRQLSLDSRESVDALMAGLQAEGVRLCGVLHCAGQVADGYIVNKLIERSAAVFAPKLAGTLLLDEATRGFDLDFFALFSSIMAETGNAGQADYACANGFMDRYAAHRDALVAQGLRSGRSIAIDWPYWRDGGMRIDASALELLRETRGMVPMPTEVGIACFHAALAQESPQCLVLHGDIARLQAQLAPQAAQAEAGAAPALDEAGLKHAVLDALAALVSEQLKLPVGRLDVEADLAECGIDSIFINKINLALSRHFKAISKTLFFQYRTVAEIAEHLLQRYAEECRAWVAMRARPADDAGVAGPTRPAAVHVVPSTARAKAGTDSAHSGAIAIVGMSGMFPHAPDVDAFWRNLVTGRDCVDEIPADRWPLDGFYEPDPERALAQGKSYSRHGAFVDGFARFDPMFFGIPPREALNIDPHERLFLQEAWRAMEDAGYSSEKLRRVHERRVGVFVGVTKTEFELNGAHDPAAAGRWYPRTSFSSIANRLSFFLDLSGPSMPIDTMCSSSLVAIHQACEQIRLGACDAAFAGGVNLYLHPSSYYYLSSLRMLAPDGRCRSFGAGGSGFVPGEGAGVLLLKSLERALADHDPVHGVILASHVNHGGRTNGFMVPNPRAQAALVRETLDKAQVDARHVSYIEAHGTGTALGDPIEIDGLQQAFTPDTSERQFCAIGSAKSNIGHLEAAAGIAGLIKVLLQMRHRHLVPSLHAEQVNPNIRLESTAFELNRELRPWARPVVDGREVPRIAGVSSFGAGGVNAHVLLSESPLPARASESEAGSDDAARRDVSAEPVPVPLSALRREQLIERARQLRDHLDTEGQRCDLAALAYTLQAGRDAMAQRVAFVVDSAHALRDALDAFVHGRAREDIFDAGTIEDLAERYASGESRVRRERAVDACFASSRDIDVRALARLWTEGAHVDWQRLYAGRPLPQRVSLPTYPFAPETYWHPRLPSLRETQAGVSLPADVIASAAADDVLVAVPVWHGLGEAQSLPACDHHAVLLCGPLRTDADALASALAQDNPAVAPRIVCTPLASDAADPARRYADLARQCFEQVRALVGNAQGGRVLLQCVVADDEDGQLQLGLSGLLRTLAMEQSRFTAQVLAVEPGLDAAQLAYRLQMLRVRPHAHLVRWREDRIDALDWERLPWRGDAAPVWRTDGVYVITGGLGALGQVFADDILARCPRATVVLTGRAGPQTASVSEARLVREGRAQYRQLDLLDETAVAGLFDELRARHGGVHGVLHCAGTIADNLIAKKTPEEFARTLAPKVEGTWNLDRASRDHALDLFVVFSSIASAMGSIGQADYASANGFMDRFADHRRDAVRRGERRGTTLAIHWPYWREGGMRVDAATEEVLMQSIGMRPMETAVGIAAFHLAVALDRPRVLVAQGDPERFLAKLRGVQPALVAPAVPATGAPAAQQRMSFDAIQRQLRDMLAQLLHARPEDIAPRKPLVELGLDSVLGTEFVGAINRRFSTGLSSVGIYDHPTLHALADYVVEAQPEAAAPSPAVASQAAAAVPAHAVREPAAAYRLPTAAVASPPAPAAAVRGDAGDTRIAVIGMSGRYPQAENLDAYWRNLVAGRNSVVEIPDTRWDTAAYYDPDPDAEGRMYCRWMGVLDHADAFDPRFFRITPQEALYMDPEQRLFLQESYRALEDAGYAGEIADGLGCGVYLGMESSEYGWHFANSPRVAETITGNHSAIAAARLAYFLNLKGPALAVDTACSSSLVAVHLACQALRAGEIDMALAGGVRLWLSPVTHIGMSRARMLSPTGQCRTFDDSADGIVMGEGVGAVVLKRLCDAERDGDEILGVILASGTNQDGRTNGITAPSVKSQIALERRVYREHGIDPDSISYIEAHGTGTKLGDPIELQALSTVFREQTSRERFCALGSVKTNIGHTAAASGVASLHKVLLCLQHGHLVPSLNIERENRHFDFQRSPFYVNRDYVPWQPGAGGRRRACVSSFGFSGTNAHLVIEECRREDARPSHDASAAVPGGERLILLSARTDAQLEQRARDLLRFVEARIAALPAGATGDAQAAQLLLSIAQTLQLGRAALEVRAAFEADSLQTLRDGLAQLCGEAHNGAASVQRGRVVEDDGTLALWRTDDDLRATAGKWLGANQLSKLIGLWLKGVDFDWRALQGNARVSRMRLPTYPFAEERYWVDRREHDAVDGGAATGRALSGPASAVGIGPLHPLVHRNISDLERQAYRTRLRAEAFLLDDHRVEGARVLPGVAYLEMARAAALLALPDAQGGHLEIVDHLWVRPIVLADAAAHDEAAHGLDVTIVLVDEGEDDDGLRRIDYEILTEPSDAGGESDGHAGGHGSPAEALLHARGTLHWSPRPAELEMIDPQALAATIDGDEETPDALYPRFQALGLQYGPRMQGIVGLRTDGRDVLARLRLPSSLGAEAAAYGLHPAVMDSAMQCTIRLLAGFDGGSAGAAMPFSIDTLQIDAPTEAEMWAWVRPSEDAPEGSGKVDIDLLDNDGVCCVRLRGLVSRALPRGGAAQSALRGLPARTGAVTDAAGSAKHSSMRALLPIWNPVSFGDDTVRPDAGERCLLLGADAVVAGWLAPAFAAFETLALPAGASVEAVQAALAERQFDHLVWCAPDVSAGEGAGLSTAAGTDADTDVDAIVAAQESGVLALFRIVKALTRLERHEHALKFTVVTRNTLQVFEDAPVAPHHAGVHGMVGSIAKEMPLWRMRLADIASIADLDARELLSLPWSAKGDSLAHRGDTWFRQEFADVVRLPQGESACRHRGTYVVIGGAGGLGEVWTRHMVERYDAHVIWIGRRAEDAAIRERLDAVEALSPSGRRPDYVSVDATDPVALAAAVDGLRARFGRIDGVVHSALVLQDQTVRAMDEAVFRGSLAAKVDVSVNMERAFGGCDLDFMLFFSSLSSYYRGAGQSNYCAGCTFKDSFAQDLRSRYDWPVKIVNWGYWGSVGIVTDPFYRKRMESLGFGSIEPEDAMAALESFLASDMEQLVLAEVISDAALDDIVVSEEIRHYADGVAIGTAVKTVGIAS